MRFLGISWRTHGRSGLKFGKLMYLDYLQKWLDNGHGLLNFLILVEFLLSETGQIWGFRAFPRKPMAGVAWNLASWCINFGPMTGSDGFWPSSGTLIVTDCKAVGGDCAIIDALLCQKLKSLITAAAETNWKHNTPDQADLMMLLLTWHHMESGRQ